MARSLFTLGFVRPSFQPAYLTRALGDSSFDALPPDQKGQQIESELDATFGLQGKIAAIVKQYGGISDSLKALLGPDANNFQGAWYAQGDLGDAAMKLYGPATDPTLQAQLTSADKAAVDQWSQAITQMSDLLAKHGAAISSAPASSPNVTLLVGGGVAAVGLGILAHLVL